MSITGGNLFFNSASNASNSTGSIKSALMKQNNSSLKNAARELRNEIDNNRTGYEMAQENVDLGAIWQRARDWGLQEQHEMAMEARTLAVRAANPGLSDNARKIVNMELDALKAETTRIGLTNNINGSHTLARYETVREITEVEEIVPGTETTVIETKPKIDVVWVLDRTGSMIDNIDHLSKDAPKMFKELQEKGFDVRMAVESFERTLDHRGSTDLRADVATFQNDLAKILGSIGGEEERGLNALKESVDRFGSKLRPDATKVTVLITDMDNYDIGHNYNIIEDEKLAPGKAAEDFRASVADALKSIDTELFVVGTTENVSIKGAWSDYYDPTTYTYIIPDEARHMPDEDYLDVVKKMGNGQAIKLDFKGKWVDTVTDKFIASVERDVKEGKFDTISKHSVETTSIELLGDWKLNFQVGNTADKAIVEKFKTSTAKTSGLENADFSSAEKARKSMSAIDAASGFLRDASTQVGTLQTRFRSIANDLANQGVWNRRPNITYISAINSYIDASIPTGI